ncbi:hypothetical protein BCR44DRAFT_49624 [Catenaria anguillulae PL171]|uniref:Uncharacterized protein n=1 Tax=Catenaria anguillulae PL171 TaxID=765915 RepID=A0A1Y2HQH7_9FUNG|nr:hypothetical protein BCR44DRAFT_49624 [Catenaria anguillulae PL171]
MTNSPSTASNHSYSSSSTASTNHPHPPNPNLNPPPSAPLGRKGSKLNKPRRDTPRRTAHDNDDLGGFILPPSSSDDVTHRDPEVDRAFQQEELERQARKVHNSQSASRSRSRSASPTRRPISAPKANTDTNTTRPKTATSTVGSTENYADDSDTDETNKRKSARARKASSARKEDVPAISTTGSAAVNKKNGGKSVKIPGQRGDQQKAVVSLDELRGRAKNKQAAAVESPASPKSAKLSPLDDNEHNLASRNRSRSASTNRSSDEGQSRRERDAVDRATLLKSELARSDMERLALIRAEREAAAARRQAEKEAKAAKMAAAAASAGSAKVGKGGAKTKVAPAPVDQTKSAAVVPQAAAGGKKDKRTAGK